MGRFVRRIRNIWAGDTWVRPFVRRYRRALLLAVGLGVAAGAFSIGLMFVAGFLLSAAAEQPWSIFELMVPLALVQIIGLARPFLSYLERLASHDWVLRMTSALRGRLFRSLATERAGLRAVGDALGLAAGDIEHVQNLYVRCAFPVCVGLAIWLACVVALLFVSPIAALIVMALAGIAAVGAPLVSAISSAARRERSKALRAELFSSATDDVLGIEDWVCSGRRDDFVDRVDAASRAMGAHDARGRAHARRRDLFVQLAGGAAVVAMAIWADARFASAVAQVSTATPAGAEVWAFGARDYIAAFAIAVFPLIEALLPMGDAAAGSAAHLGAVERLNMLPDPGAEPDREPDGIGIAALLGIDAGIPEGRGADENIRVEGNGGNTDGSGSGGGGKGVERTMQASPQDSPAAMREPPDLVFRQATWRYPRPGGPAGSTVPEGGAAIDRLDLHVPFGQKVCLLGPSGSGKSTLLALAHGDYMPTAGTVQIGGRATCGLGGGIASLVGMVHQDPYVFDLPLIDNLRIAMPDATEEQCWEALERVGLRGAVEAMPAGLASPMGEGGSRLSGGQRHRLALARILLADVPVVLLDEPMASVDPVTEAGLLSTLLDVFDGRTVVMATHHLLGAGSFDRVVFLENGRIAKDGDVPLDGSPAFLKGASPRFRRLLAFDRGEDA